MEVGKTDREIMDRFREENPWGLCCAIDMKNCDPDIIRDEDRIKVFVRKLCELIDMKRFGDTVVVDFGEDPRVSGFSMTQLIETSLISGHFVNQDNSAYLDIFSCKAYPPHKAAEFCQTFFKAEKVKTNILFRY